MNPLACQAQGQVRHICTQAFPSAIYIIRAILKEKILICIWSKELTFGDKHGTSTSYVSENDSLFPLII